jgi:hypothetical protein
MTVMTVVTDPTLERSAELTPKILDLFTKEQFKAFTSYPGARGDSLCFDDWLEEFISNSMFVVVVDGRDEIQGCITAKNSQEEAQVPSIDKEPLLVTGFYSHPRSTEQEEGMIEVLIEVAVLTGHRFGSIPNTTELMRNFTNHILFNHTFDEVEIILTGEPSRDCFDISNFKTYSERVSA